MARGVKAAPIRWWIVAPAAALALGLLPLPAWVVDEFYSRDFYPWVQRWVTALSNVLPLAVIDVLIGGAVALALVRLGLLVRSIWQQGVGAALAELARRVVRAAGVVALVFLAMWGCNYRRIPLAGTLPGGSPAPTTADVQLAVTDANALAASLRPAVLAGPELSYTSIAEQLREPMDAALRHLNRPPLSRPGRPKFSILLTPFFTRAGVNGMVNPFALESIVHPDLLPFERPFVLAHEWAHLAGQADEAEASAVGWLACMYGDPPLAYSASLYLIMEAAGALPPATRQPALAALDPGVRADLEAIARRTRLEDPRVQRATSEVYDRYLRANQVADGGASYRRALSLILAPPLRQALDTYGRPAR